MGMRYAAIILLAAVIHVGIAAEPSAQVAPDPILIPVGTTWVGTTMTAMAFPAERQSVPGDASAVSFSIMPLGDGTSIPVAIQISELPSPSGVRPVAVRAIGVAKPIGNRIHITIQQMTAGGALADSSQPDQRTLAWALAGLAAQAGDQVDQMSVAAGVIPPLITTRAMPIAMGQTVGNAITGSVLQLHEAVIPAGTQLRFIMGRSIVLGRQASP